MKHIVQKSLLAGILFGIYQYITNILLAKTTFLLAVDPITAAAGIAALGKAFMGTTTTQKGTQRQYTKYRPEDIAAIESARGGVVSGTQGLLDQLTQARQNLREGIMMPSTGFAFSATPDPYTRALASFMGQGTMQQAAAQRQDIARRLPGSVGQILGRQIDMQTRLSQNPNTLLAMQDQRSRELTQRQQQQAEVDASNRTRFALEQGLAQLAGTGLGAQSNLLAQQLGLGQAFGENIAESFQRSRSK